MKTEVKQVLEDIQSGVLSIDEALLKLKMSPYEDIGYAKIDTHRRIRQGFPEVIYGAGKTPEQIRGIVDKMREKGQARILITRLSEEAAQILSEESSGYTSEEISSDPSEGSGFKYYPDARIGIFGGIPEADGIGMIVIATGGTSDIPVAEEAALTAECFGNEVVRLYDVGVAGMHRLLSHMDEIMSASVIITIAGMEGALASVIGGLADCPVIAVPTSVGYGASFNGLSALLSMLNSCASGVSVVNIDNGYGAGYMAGLINHMEVKREG